MGERIHFGLIGIKIGDKIIFKLLPEIAFNVGSGNGEPENGGTLVQYADNPSIGLFEINGLTRKLMDVKKLPDDFDLWSHWTYKGLSLREIYNSKNGIT